MAILLQAMGAMGCSPSQPPHSAHLAVIEDLSRSWGSKGVCVLDTYLSSGGTPLEKQVVEAVRADGYRVIGLEVHPDTASIVVAFNGRPVGGDSVSMAATVVEAHVHGRPDRIPLEFLDFEYDLQCGGRDGCRVVERRMISEGHGLITPDRTVAC